MMNEEQKLITWECYEKMKTLYTEKGFLLYSFPCTAIEPVKLAANITLNGIAFRLMDVDTPLEVTEDMWEYLPNVW